MAEKLKQGDYGYDLTFITTDQSGNALNLSGGSVWFKAWAVGSTSIYHSGICTISGVGESGISTYTVPSGTFPSIGTFEWENEVVYSSKKISTFRTENIVISKSL